MSLIQLIAQFIDDRRTGDDKPGGDRPMAKSTLTTQGTWNRTFARWVGDTAEIGDFNEARLRQFKLAQENAGKRPRTIRSAVLSLRAFGAWCVKTKKLNDNPALCLNMPVLDAPRRKTASDKEVFALLDGCDRIADTRRAAVARYALSMLIYSGVRRKELLSLQLHNLDVEEACVYVDFGKGGKARTVYLPDECVNAIRGWMAVREDSKKRCNHSYVMDYDHSRRIGDQGLRTLIIEVRAAAGLKESTHLLPHTLRHNYATRLMQAGGDLESIKENLGHSSIAITAVYLHTSPEQKRKTAQLASRPSVHIAPAPPLMSMPPGPIRPPAPRERNQGFRKRQEIRR